MHVGGQKQVRFRKYLGSMHDEGEAVNNSLYSTYCFGLVVINCKQCAP
jgi:hypothetical protein